MQCYFINLRNKSRLKVHKKDLILNAAFESFIIRPCVLDLSIMNISATGFLKALFAHFNSVQNVVEYVIYVNVISVRNCL